MESIIERREAGKKIGTILGELATKPRIVSQTQPRRVGDGRIFIKEYTPKYPETLLRSSGQHGKQILYTDAYLLGRESVNAKGELIKVDKRVVYGVVTACGTLVNRSTTERFGPEKQGDFPLPSGTLVKVSKASADWRTAPDEDSYPTYDVIEWLLPGEHRKPELWGVDASTM